ncbi:Protein of unknown function [Gryllus bimaculatus]|nr:Protein of unknown function [Gryllus bimaculatus]
MIMKIPDDSNKSYNGHESSSPYMSDSSGNGDDVDPPTMDGDFSEYLWMEHEEEFDKQFEQNRDFRRIDVLNLQ